MSGTPDPPDFTASPTSTAGRQVDVFDALDVLDDSLRFEDLSEDEQARVVEEPSWVQAVQAAIWLLHGDRAAVTMFPDSDAHTAVAVFARGGTCHFGTFGGMATDWPNRRRLANGHRALDETSGALIPADVAARQQSVGYAIEATFAQRDDVTTLLRDADFADPTNRPYLAPIVTAWWTERMDGGLTGDTAWMMLGLLAPPATFALLMRSTGQAPPTVTATPPTT